VKIEDLKDGMEVKTKSGHTGTVKSIGLGRKGENIFLSFKLRKNESVHISEIVEIVA
jgi:preprotein translocase subunit YajC